MTTEVFVTGSPRLPGRCTSWGRQLEIQHILIGVVWAGAFVALGVTPSPRLLENC